jgi:hypothetical protein
MIKLRMKISKYKKFLFLIKKIIAVKRKAEDNAP